MALRVDAGADGEAHAVAALQRRRRLAQQHRHHHAQVVHDGGARLVHLRPPARGAEAVGLHLAVAAQHHAVEGQDRRVDVEQRQRVVEAVGAVAEAGQATRAGIPAAGFQLVAVRQHAALGPAGGARGVEHAGGRVGCGRGAQRRRRASSAVRCRRRRGAPLRLVRRGLDGRLQQRLQFVGHDHQVHLRMLQHIGHLARTVVGVERHAADAQRIHRQLVQQVLGPVLQQQRDAMAHAVAGVGTVGLHQRAHGLRRCGSSSAHDPPGGSCAPGWPAPPGRRCPRRPRRTGRRCRRWWRRGQGRSRQPP